MGWDRDYENCGRIGIMKINDMIGIMKIWNEIGIMKIGVRIVI